MAYPLTSPEEVVKAFEIGRCRDCGTKIPPIGDSSRCGPCDEKFSIYMSTGWGLDALVSERLTNRVLGHCFICGNNFDGSQSQICIPCQEATDNHRRSKKLVWLTETHNPYKSVWDTPEPDNTTCLTPTHGIIAERILAKAKHFKRMSERGGPRGREYLEEARSYVRIAAKLLEREKQLRRTR